MPLLLPVGLGLLGFIEPCTLGSTLIFVKFLEAKGRGRQLVETLSFLLVRALVIGTFGAVAALFGAKILGIQKMLWIALGGLYAVIGLLYLSGRIAPLMVRVGPSLASLSGLRGSVGLGVLFGLNIPACAGPLILALLATAALHDGGAVMRGFISLAAFGVALSLPVIAAVLIPPARRFIDRLGTWSRRMPIITGFVFIALGVWSIGFGLFVSIGHASGT
ncbi:cytochrome c biogenesis protein CcdA [Acidocella facilis]|uniref:cytochrome c biogenesis protein CcdA n=1 Tax=Acidocella facilis TaxID=525 RepID=UPI001F3AB0A5|nr:cytochrome c biogenesis protein CcdA [Acidocella facilis]